MLSRYCLYHLTHSLPMIKSNHTNGKRFMNRSLINWLIHICTVLCSAIEFIVLTRILQLDCLNIRSVLRLSYHTGSLMYYTSMICIQLACMILVIFINMYLQAERKTVLTLKVPAEMNLKAYVICCIFLLTLFDFCKYGLSKWQ